MQPQIRVATADGIHDLGNERRVLLAGHDVTALAKGDSGWWAVIDGDEVWRSTDGGDWTRAAPVEKLRGNCLLATATDLFVGTSEARLLALREKRFEPVGPFDQVEGRDEWFTPWGGPPDVRSMSADPSGPVYVNVHVGGIVRSIDGGSTWEPTIDIRSDVHDVLFDPGSRQVLAASARGLASSSDGGGSWRFDSDGLHGGYLRAVAVAGGTVLVTASTGPFTERAAVYRRAVEGGQSFERCRKGLPEWFPDNIDTSCLAASGPNVAFGTSEGAVYVSSDEGSGWTAAAEGLPQVRCVAFA